MKTSIHFNKATILLLMLLLHQSGFSQTATGCWKSFSSGEMFSLAITSNGQLWSWGFNNFAQLGLGTQGNTSIQKKAQIGTDTDWKEVEAGFEYGLALKENGTLWGWGANYYGMLGDGTGETRKSPVQIGTDTDWSKISPGVVHTLALKSDGTLWAWGRNKDGQIGDGTNAIRAVPTQIGVDKDWLEISTGERHSVAIKANGTLWAWGVYDNGQLGLGNTSFTSINVPNQVGSSSDWKLISAGRNFNLAIKNDGTLWSWGQNDYGQLGNGFSFGGSNVPIQIGADTDWASIATGALHSMALKTNGTRWAWGSNGNGSNNSGSAGALGDSTKTDKNIPIQIGTDTDWEKLQAGKYFSFCLKKDGTLWSNGSNLAGALGDGTAAIRLFPVLVSCPIVLTNLEFENSSISIYPNPSAGIFSIQAPLTMGNATIVISDLHGRIVYQQKTNNIESKVLELSFLQNGIYLLKIAAENGIFVQKIIKQ